MITAKYIFLFLLYILIEACHYKSDKQTQSPTSNTNSVMQNNSEKNYNYVIFSENNNTYEYGYQILLGNKLYINQHTIPAVSGFQYFKTEDEAKKVAELIIFKLKANKGLPTISIEELDSLGIQYNKF